MVKHLAAVFAAALLTGCASLDFYAPEVGADWSSESVKVGKSGPSLDGVTVHKVGEEYSQVVSVGNLMAPAYQGGRKESWAVEGPGGFSATVELIQSDLIFSGPVSMNVLKADSIDFTQGRQAVKVTQASESTLSEPGPVTSPAVFKVLGLGVVPVYQGKSGGKVSDYKKWGLSTGLRLTQRDALAGFLSTTNGTSLMKKPGDPLDPLLTALALISVQPHFEGRTPAQKVVPEVIEVFGLKLTSQTSHN